MNRIAPKAGYDFPQKQHYRQIIWRRFTDIAGSTRSNSHVLLMPSIEGLEIDAALRRGFREEHLHVVDKTPAIVAHLKRRYPKIHTYGCDVVPALERIRRAGYPLAFLNLDLCGNMSNKTWRTLRRCVEQLLVRPTAIAVTVLRGRETKLPQATAAIARSAALWRERGYVVGELDVARRIHHQPIIDGDVVRLTGVMTALSIDDRIYIPRARDLGIYRSTAGAQTMLWSIWRPWDIVMAARPFSGEMLSGEMCDGIVEVRF